MPLHLLKDMSTFLVKNTINTKCLLFSNFQLKCHGHLCCFLTFIVMPKPKLLLFPKGIKFPYVWAFRSKNKRHFYHAFVSSSFIFFIHSLFHLFFCTSIYSLSLPWPRCLNNEHEDCQKMYPNLTLKGCHTPMRLISGKM